MYKDYLFGTKGNNKHKKPIGKIILKVIKILLYSFLFISMLWGCSEMFVSKYSTYQIVDSAGNSIYKPGVFFEILISPFANWKNHYFHWSNGKYYEYPFLSISSWNQAFVETQSPFYGLFVYPTAWILTKLIVIFGGEKNGIASGASVIFSILIMAIFVRIITLSFSWKGQMNQEKMQLLQVQQNEIKNKYKNSNDPMSKQKQQQEIMEMYKKNKMSPLSTMATSFLSFPFLFALYISIKSTRALKSATIGQISLIEKPWSMITSGHVIYLTLLAVYFPLQILSVFLPTILSLYKKENKTPEQKKAKRKQFIMQGVFVVVFMFVAVSVASGVAIYWIFSSGLQIMQTLMFHYVRIWNSKKYSRLKEKEREKKRKEYEIEKNKLKEINASIKVKKTNEVKKPKNNNKKKTKKKIVSL